ncbi:hypothetical protein QTO34_018422 [Cnephaeus nilssonii]|uniref:GH18 domain-containing protein n=1 Tax=Cnephaeus nilssonii TaxID=3371016 RepID=A0AA40HYT0_CNENI|nr:hypothetical protein QTO34_018422 [Eptesicus nilssonii]
MSRASRRLPRLLGRPRSRAPGIAPLLLLLLLPPPLGAGADCPCRDPALCRPIRNRPNFEVFVFDVGDKTWKSYDWSQITTVALFGKYDSELMCYAHSKGARVVLKGECQFLPDVSRQLVTFDVAWSPKCIDRRCYNYTGIADACDFLFVMSYDEQSQVWSECIAAANAPYNQTITAYDDYIKMGINPKKLVMGLPWYGYDYTCLTLSEDHVCTIAKVPFRGAPCSDAAGRQVPYKIIMKQVKSSLSGILWDENQKSPYYNYKDSAGQFHQVWYDNPKSISLKTAYIQTWGLRGIGMWNANCLDYSGDAVAKQQTEEMWEALKPKL